MKWFNYVIIAGVILAYTASASAGGIFGSKRGKETPDQQVQKLISILATSKNAYERADAADSLREFDTNRYPQIVPILVHSLKNDDKVIVRIEAARTLGRIRPLVPIAGDALGDAALKDSAFRVRWQARASLMVYSMAGIKPGNIFQTSRSPERKDEGDPKSSIPVRTVPNPIRPTVPPIGVTIPPPPNTDNNDGFARPLPKGPEQVPIQPIGPSQPAGSPEGLIVPNRGGEPPLAQPTGNSGTNEPGLLPIPNEGPILNPPGN